METTLKNPNKILENSLRKLRIIVDAQPNVADGSFFSAAQDYRKKGEEIIKNGDLGLDVIKKHDKTYRMLTIG